ncbi:MAG: hypothetical protein GY820_23490 [Gammaproteobacteria bacterium]|nr:hypothetical protein [Gammaproteobacteria bacterium]
MKIKQYSLFIVLIALLGCEQASDSASKIVPLYKSCLKNFETYKTITKTQYDIDLSIRLFDVDNGYPAHPGLVGIVTINNRGSSENQQIVENGLELLCFPTHSMTTDSDELGYRIVKETLATNREQGKLENYIVISNGEAVVHFNNTSQEMKEGILRP